MRTSRVLRRATPFQWIALLFLFHALPFTESCLAASNLPPAVVLLTSLSSPKIWFEPASWNLNAQLERDFRQAFAHSGYRVVVQHEATAYDLSLALRSEQNVGVFWVSHAAAESESNISPLGKGNVILDEGGVNVMDVFQVIHPNLRWLSVVGCETESILDGFKQAQMFRNNPLLTVQDYARPVDAETALADSLNASIPVLGADPRSKTAAQIKAESTDNDHSDNDSNDYDIDSEGDPLYWEANQDVVSPFPIIFGTPALLVGSGGGGSCVAEEPGIEMMIQRSIPVEASDHALSEVLVYFGSHLLSVLPKPVPGQTQSVTVPISSSLLASETQASGGALRMTVSTRATGIPALKPILGQFSFQSALGDWDLFADSTGQAIGVTSHLYLHHGPLAPISAGTVPIMGCVSPAVSLTGNTQAASGPDHDKTY